MAITGSAAAAAAAPNAKPLATGAAAGLAAAAGAPNAKPPAAFQNAAQKFGAYRQNSNKLVHM